MKPQRGVLIGAGFFAQFQAEAWRRLPGAEIVAIADSYPGKAREFADRFGIPRCYAAVETMLETERPDFVDIATRPESHLPLSVLAAGSGANVICQKPMAPTMAESAAMCDACEKRGVRLLIHENWRWQPWYREARKRIAAGDIGEPTRFSFLWRTGDGVGAEPYAAQPYFRSMPRLLIYESLVHILDTFRFLGGACSVSACRIERQNPVISGEDTAIIELKFHSGASGIIDGNRLDGPAPAPVAMGTCEISGTDGVLRIAPDGTMRLQRSGEAEHALPFSPEAGGYKGDSVFATQRHLLESLQSGAQAETEGRRYLETVALVEDAYRLAGPLR
jgi:predicted dehydrogenase